MANKEIIKILFIDNNKQDVEIFLKVQDIENNPDTTHTKIQFLEGNIHFHSERSREDHKREIKNIIDSNLNNIDILLLDLMLRTDEKKAINRDLGLNLQLLSVEIAKEYEEKFSSKGKLIGFTSGYNYIKSKSSFRAFQQKNKDSVSENWFFVMKPVFEDDEPKLQKPCSELCKFQKYHRKIECNCLQCIHHQLVSLF